jgi:hypothetical protein
MPHDKLLQLEVLHVQLGKSCSTLSLRIKAMDTALTLHSFALS